jgi:multiple sugar transport system permease protein
MRANPPRTPFTRRDERRFYLFILPWLLGLVLFQAGPILAALALSLTDWNLVADPQWRGLTHYDELSSDPLFRTALRNTLYYSLVSVPLGVGLAFSLALLVNRSWFGMGAFRTVFLLPALVSGAAIALVWGWLFNPRFGAINSVLRSLNLPTPGWLADPSWAMPTIILLSLWSVGGTMLIYLAGLRTIPRELYDAARIDGGGPLALTRYVTLPLLSPTTYFLLVVGTIMSLQLFTPTYILTEGGPRNSTLTLPLYIYRNAFEFQKFGYAAALSVVLILLTLILTLIQVTVARRWVFYAGAAPGLGGR